MTSSDMAPPGEGQPAWTEKLLSTFDGSDGNYPVSGLLALKVGKSAALFGATLVGGSNGWGVVYEITGSGFVF